MSKEKNELHSLMQSHLLHSVWRSLFVNHNKHEKLSITERSVINLRISPSFSFTDFVRASIWASLSFAFNFYKIIYVNWKDWKRMTLLELQWFVGFQPPLLLMKWDQYHSANTEGNFVTHPFPSVFFDTFRFQFWND